MASAGRNYKKYLKSLQERAGASPRTPGGQFAPNPKSKAGIMRAKAEEARINITTTPQQYQEPPELSAPPVVDFSDARAAVLESRKSVEASEQRAVVEIERSARTEARKQIAMIDRISMARKKMGIEPTPMEKMVIGTSTKTGIRQNLMDFRKRNPELFNTETLEGAANTEILMEAIELAESALRADTEDAQAIYERMKFLLTVAEKQGGADSPVAKQIRKMLKPIADSIQQKTTLAAYTKDRIKTFSEELPETIVSKIPGIGGFLAGFMRQKRLAKKRIEQYSGRLQERISERVGGKITGRGAISPRQARIQGLPVSGGFADGGTAREMMLKTGATPASQVFGSVATGIDESDPEKNPLGGIYEEVVKIRQLVEESMPGKDKTKKEESAKGRFEKLWESIFGKKGGDKSGGGGGGGGGDGGGGGGSGGLLKNLLRGGAGGGMFAGLMTPGMSVASAGAGSIAAYGLAGAAIGTAAAFAINKGLDKMFGAKEGDGLADYQFRASTYDPTKFLNVGNYGTKTDQKVDLDIKQKAHLATQQTEAILSGRADAQEIARNVANDVMTLDEAKGAIGEAIKAGKYDPSFMKFFEETQEGYSGAHKAAVASGSSDAMIGWNRKYMELRKKYGMDDSEEQDADAVPVDPTKSVETATEETDIARAAENTAMKRQAQRSAMNRAQSTAESFGSERAYRTKDIKKFEDEVKAGIKTGTPAEQELAQAIENLSQIAYYKTSTDSEGDPKYGIPDSADKTDPRWNATYKRNKKEYEDKLAAVKVAAAKVAQERKEKKTAESESSAEMPPDLIRAVEPATEPQDFVSLPKEQPQEAEVLPPVLPSDMQQAKAEAAATESSAPTAPTAKSKTEYKGRNFKMNLGQTNGAITIDGVPLSELTTEELEMTKRVYGEVLKQHLNKKPKDTQTRQHDIWEHKKQLYEDTLRVVEDNLRTKSQTEGKISPDSSASAPTAAPTAAPLDVSATSIPVSAPTAAPTAKSKTEYTGRNFKMNLGQRNGEISIDGVPLSELTTEELEMTKRVYGEVLKQHLNKKPKDTQTRQHDIWEHKKELYEDTLRVVEDNLRTKSQTEGKISSDPSAPAPLNASATSIPVSAPSAPVAATAENVDPKTEYKGRNLKMNLGQRNGEISIDGVPVSELTTEELEMTKRVYGKVLQEHNNKKPKDTQTRQHDIWEHKKELYENTLQLVEDNLRRKSQSETATVVPPKANTTVGAMTSAAENERQNLEKTKTAATQSDSKDNTVVVANNNKSSTVVNNFNEDLRIRNNEPTLRQMQREVGWAARA